MKIVVCDDDALVYEQMKNIIASYSIVKNENLELTFYQTVEELLHAKHMSKNFNFHKLIFQPPRITFCAGVVSFCRRTSKTSYNAQ